MSQETKEGDAPSMNATQSEIDACLQFIVKLADVGHSTYGVTLNVNGSIISGTVIPVETYFKELSELITQTISDRQDTGPALQPIADFSDEYVKALRETRDQPSYSDGYRPTYIHLKNVRMYNEGGKYIPTVEGILWRGKLKDVSGFVFGSISV